MISLTRSRSRSKSGIMIQAMPAIAANAIMSGSRSTGGPICKPKQQSPRSAKDHLTFDTEIPKSHAKSDGCAYTNKNERRRLKQDRMKVLRVGEIFEDEFLQQRRRLYARGDQQTRRDPQSDRDGTAEDQRLTPKRNVLAHLDIDASEAQSGHFLVCRGVLSVCDGQFSSMMHHDAADGLPVYRRVEFGGNPAAGHDPDAIGKIEHLVEVIANQYDRRASRARV